MPFGQILWYCTSVCIFSSPFRNPIWCDGAAAKAMWLYYIVCSGREGGVSERRRLFVVSAGGAVVSPNDVCVCVHVSLGQWRYTNDGKCL